MDLHSRNVRKKGLCNPPSIDTLSFKKRKRKKISDDSEDLEKTREADERDLHKNKGEQYDPSGLAPDSPDLR